MNSSLEDKIDHNNHERKRSNSGKSNFSLISTASTKNDKKKIVGQIPNNRYKKYVFDKKFEEKPLSSKDLKDKHNFANKDSAYVANFNKPDLDVETKKERIKMLNINLKGNYGQKFALNKNKI